MHGRGTSVMTIIITGIVIIIVIIITIRCHAYCVRGYSVQLVRKESVSA